MKNLNKKNGKIYIMLNKYIRWMERRTQNKKMKRKEEEYYNLEKK